MFCKVQEIQVHVTSTVSQLEAQSCRHSVVLQGEISHCRIKVEVAGCEHSVYMLIECIGAIAVPRHAQR